MRRRGFHRKKTAISLQKHRDFTVKSPVKHREFTVESPQKYGDLPVKSRSAHGENASDGRPGCRPAPFRPNPASPGSVPAGHAAGYEKGER
jgi:hypothetical protein